MAIKKNGSSNSSTKDINKPKEDRNKTFDLKSAAGKQTIAASTGNLRVTGATVSGIPDTASVTIQCTISEDNKEENLASGNKVEESTKLFDSDTDGFVVKRLLKGEQENKSTENQEQEISSVPTVAYYSSTLKPPPTAPRSSPTNELLPLTSKEHYNRT